jgi:hypothetical protein
MNACGSCLLKNDDGSCSNPQPDIEIDMYGDTKYKIMQKSFADDDFAFLNIDEDGQFGWGGKETAAIFDKKTALEIQSILAFETTLLPNLSIVAMDL